MKKNLILIILFSFYIFNSCGIAKKNAVFSIEAYSFNSRIVSILLIENFRNQEALILTNMFGGGWETFTFANKNVNKDSILFKNNLYQNAVNIQEKSCNKSGVKQFSVTIVDEKNNPLNSMPYHAYINKSLIFGAIRPLYTNDFIISEKDTFSVYVPYFNVNFKKIGVKADDSLVLQVKSSKDFVFNYLYYDFENFSINLNSEGQIDSNSVFKFDSRGFSIGNCSKTNISKKELKRFNLLKDFKW